MPSQIADGIVDQVQSGSAVGVLSQQKAMRFGETSIVTFENRPKAEFVDEGVQKSSTTGSFGVVKTAPHKTQVTMRFDQEVQWADSDYQSASSTSSPPRVPRRFPARSTSACSTASTR